jgi:hypothetical protein
MKKTCFALLILFASLLCPIQNASAENDLKSLAIKKLQNAVIKALPADSNIVRLAVLDFEGDDGTVRDALTSAITEKTTFKVIERADLDKILSEQGLQLKDIMDEKTRIEHGRIKGVQGILFGKVLGMESGFMSFTVKVHLKLDDVEKGEILLSKDFNISAVSPVRTWIIYGAIGLIVLIVVITMLKKRRVTVIESTIKEDVKARIDLVKEINRAITNISEAKAKLMDKGRTDDAVLLKDAERDIMLLKEHVDNAARGSADMRKTKEFKDALEFDKGIISSLESLTRSADRLYETVISGNTGNLGREVDVIKKDIKDAINEFQNRGF